VLRPVAWQMADRAARILELIRMPELIAIEAAGPGVGVRRRRQAWPQGGWAPNIFWPSW